MKIYACKKNVIWVFICIILFVFTWLQKLKVNTRIKIVKNEY